MFLGPKNFWIQKGLGRTRFFLPSFFRAHSFFDPKIVWTQKILDPNFGPKIFLNSIFWDPIYFQHKFFDLNFWTRNSIGSKKKFNQKNFESENMTNMKLKHLF